NVISGEGPVQFQAQNGAMSLSAQQKISLVSTGDMLFAGKKKVTLIGGGSYLKIGAFPRPAGNGVHQRRTSTNDGQQECGNECRRLSEYGRNGQHDLNAGEKIGLFAPNGQTECYFRRRPGAVSGTERCDVFERAAKNQSGFDRR
ncbi:DUF2345 domain-containing protein, partial [Cronobacter malonaticus]|uniref:DUF2345 domain-containing protein n=1 Tax=Cronobacter malonaticus TaxID=413503 RepID=UPI00131A3946